MNLFYSTLSLFLLLRDLYKFGGKLYHKLYWLAMNSFVLICSAKIENLL